MCQMCHLISGRNHVFKIGLAQKHEQIRVARNFHKIHLKEGQKLTNLAFRINSLAIMGPENKAFEIGGVVDCRSTF